MYDQHGNFPLRIQMRCNCDLCMYLPVGIPTSHHIKCHLDRPRALPPTQHSNMTVTTCISNNLNGPCPSRLSPIQWPQPMLEKPNFEPWRMVALSRTCWELGGTTGSARSDVFWMPRYIAVRYPRSAWPWKASTLYKVLQYFLRIQIGCL